MTLRLRGTHTLGDFLNDTFSLVPRIWKKALPVSLAALAPGAILMIAAMGSFSAWIKDAVGSQSLVSSDPTRVLKGMGPAFLSIAAAALLFLLGRAYQKAFICSQVGAALESRDPSLAELASDAFKPALLRIVVQDLAIAAGAFAIASAAFSLCFLPFVFGKIVDIASLKSADFSKAGFMIQFMGIYFLAILIAGAAVWWLKVKTAVSAPAAVLEDRNSISGIGRSLDLTRGRGWRIFGTMFVINLVISFGLGILTGPITFGVAMPGYFSFLKESLGGGTPSPESMIALFSSMGWALGVTALISGVVEGSLWTSFLTLLHADLRARGGELRESSMGRPGLSGARRLRSLGLGWNGPRGR